ncbi:hypothetical protein Tco_1081433 [Tanacetum coccineum]|uniref:Uncharacterized protein n=1 Tax=Tanacetum coccineum TaxID=301880 RepID=A0ABQ5HZI8_9ASTR
MHQPWRSFAAIINKCLSGKTTALESLRLSRAQILWGMYHNKQVDYVYLLWEDLVFQVENKNSKKNNDMYYPCFTKVIVDYFMAKDQAIPRRNKMFWHYARDDFMFTTIRVISKHKDIQEYGAILPQHLTNQAMLESEAFKTYRAYATGEKAPKSKATKKRMDSDHLQRKAFSSSKGDGVDILSKVLDEQQQTRSGTNEGAGDKPEVPDVPELPIQKNEEEFGLSVKEKKKEEEKADDDDDDDDVTSDQKVSTPPDMTHQCIDGNKQDDDYMGEEQGVKDNGELSSASSDLVAKFINPSPDTGIDFILNPNAAVSITPPTATISPQHPFHNSTSKQTHDSTTKQTNPTTTMPEIPNFSSLFGFERRVSSLESDLSELKQTNQFAEALSYIPALVDNTLMSIGERFTVDMVVTVKIRQAKRRS